MMDKNIDLDAMFAEAAAQPARVSPDLMARLLSDADMAQPRPQALAPQALSGTAPRRAGWLSALAEALGGRRALAGLSLAGLTGLFLGVVQPTGVQSLTTLLSQSTVTADQMDLLPAPDTIWPDTDRTGN